MNIFYLDERVPLFVNSTQSVRKIVTNVFWSLFQFCVFVGGFPEFWLFVGSWSKEEKKTIDDSVPTIKMTSIRKRGASGIDDDDNDVESSAVLMMDTSLSKSKPMMAKKNDNFQNVFQWIATVLVVTVVFVLSYNGTLKGRLL